MRRIQLIRRRRFSGLLFFVAFSWAGLGMGIDIKSGLIAKDFSTFLEEKLNTIFVNKEVRLSRVEGGLFNKLAIHDFTVSNIFSADKIMVKYNLLDLAFRRFERLGEVYLISPSLFFTPTLRSKGSLLKSAYSPRPIRIHILNGSITGLGREPILKNLKGDVTFYNSDLLFNNLKGVFFNLPVLVNGKIENLLETPVIKLSILANERYYTLRCTYKGIGQLDKGYIWGYLRLFDRFTLYFKGRLNTASKETIEIDRLTVAGPLPIGAICTLGGQMNLGDKSSKFIIMPKAAGGHIKLISNINKDTGVSIYAKLGHINLLGYDVLSQIDININFYKAGEGQEIMKGTLRTQNFILNYKPFREIRASWILKKRELFITNLELGEGWYRGFGKIVLNKPYYMDLNLSINNADITDWLVFSKLAKEGTFSGFMSGNIKIKGPLDSPVTKGTFRLEEGNINDIRFDAINFNLKGKGPVVTVSDSRIYKEGGFLFVNGEIDLRKFGKRNILEDIKIETDQRVIVWEGWDITKGPTEVKATKDLGEDFGINFKTYVNTPDIDEDQKRSEIGLDYKIKKEDSINVRMKDDSAFVGVEHKIKF